MATYRKIPSFHESPTTPVMSGSSRKLVEMVGSFSDDIYTNDADVRSNKSNTSVPYNVPTEGGSSSVSSTTLSDDTLVTRSSVNLSSILQEAVRTATMAMIAVFIVRFRVLVVPAISCLTFMSYEVRQVATTRPYRGSVMDTLSPILVGIGLALMHSGSYVKKSGEDDSGEAEMNGIHWSYTFWTGEALVMAIFTYNSDPTQKSTTLGMASFIACCALTRWLRGKLWRYFFLLGIEGVLALVYAAFRPDSWVWGLGSATASSHLSVNSRVVVSSGRSVKSVPLVVTKESPSRRVHNKADKVSRTSTKSAPVASQKVDPQRGFVGESSRRGLGGAGAAVAARSMAAAAAMVADTLEDDEDEDEDDTFQPTMPTATRASTRRLPSSSSGHRSSSFFTAGSDKTNRTTNRKLGPSPGLEDSTCDQRSLEDVAEVWVTILPHKASVIAAYNASGESSLPREEFEAFLRFTMFYRSFWNDFAKDGLHAPTLNRADFLKVADHLGVTGDSAHGFDLMDENGMNQVSYEVFCTWMARNTRELGPMDMGGRPLQRRSITLDVEKHKLTMTSTIEQAHLNPYAQPVEEASTETDYSTDGNSTSSSMVSELQMQSKRTGTTAEMVLMTMPSEQVAMDLFHELDVNRTGTLGFGEVSKVWKRLFSRLPQKASVTKAWMAADQASAGALPKAQFEIFLRFIVYYNICWKSFAKKQKHVSSLSRRDFSKVWSSLGAAGEADEIFDMMDVERSGNVSYDDFVTFLARHTCEWSGRGDDNTRTRDMRRAVRRAERTSITSYTTLQSDVSSVTAWTDKDDISAAFSKRTYDDLPSISQTQDSASVGSRSFGAAAGSSRQRLQEAAGGSSHGRYDDGPSGSSRRHRYDETHRYIRDDHASASRYTEEDPSTDSSPGLSLDVKSVSSRHTYHPDSGATSRSVHHDPKSFASAPFQCSKRRTSFKYTNNEVVDLPDFMIANVPPKALALKTFDEHDHDKTKTLSFGALGKVGKKLYHRLAHKASLKKACQAADESDNGVVKREEIEVFLRYIAYYNNAWDGFILYDGKTPYHCNNMDRSEFRSVAGTFGFKGNADDAFDLVHGGRGDMITYDDLCMWMARNTCEWELDYWC
uniref:EF-hand domain-containing protein n=1 Tax=Grammatophora oceanica TaxID=210454 RepID=A0A7S1VNL4_9STRA|mmetsp:Transcript_50250/g.75018  ORF Transcript_50250/g.75018 Transcript_50250/m.75018 type:complete len:1112 (+) Transcript_50250:232-3567(+)